MLTPRYIVIHHSATADGKTLSIDDFRRFHMEPPPVGNGWNDIGYHAVIEQVESGWEVLVGRPWTVAGAHAPGYNDKSLGVCLAGNFEESGPPRGQLQVAAAFVRWVCALYSIPTTHIIGHRDATAGRTCPGKYFDLPEFRRMVGATREVGE